MAFGLKKYKVIFNGRSGLLYKESEKTLTVDSEMLSESLGVAIFAESIKSWDAPYSEEPLSDEDRSRIIKNIKKDLEKQKHKVILVGNGIVNKESAPAPAENSGKPEKHTEIESY
ncbi:MAG: Imm74 family immunity protein [Dehalococcoidia bacterium]|jgi:hypothetical protein